MKPAFRDGVPQCKENKHWSSPRREYIQDFCSPTQWPQKFCSLISHQRQMSHILSSSSTSHPQLQIKEGPNCELMQRNPSQQHQLSSLPAAAEGQESSSNSLAVGVNSTSFSALQTPNGVLCVGLSVPDFHWSDKDHQSRVEAEIYYQEQ